MHNSITPMSSSTTMLKKIYFYYFCYLCFSMCFRIKPKRRCLLKVCWDKSVCLLSFGAGSGGLGCNGF